MMSVRAIGLGVELELAVAGTRFHGHRNGNDDPHLYVTEDFGQTWQPLQVQPDPEFPAAMLMEEFEAFESKQEVENFD